MTRRRWLTLLLVLCHCGVAFSDDNEREAAKKGEKKADSPSERLVTTEHKVKIGGKEIAYQATAGKLAIKSDELESRADVFFVAYTVKPKADENRPITFCFNGGPGSSSVWLHLGMLGPRRIVLPEDAKPLPPPYKVEDNPYSLLDLTDLVFIDPVSTGYSRPAKEVKKSEFHGYDEDVRSVAQFIHDYTTRFQRWGSPKFLCGESYGGIRAAGLSGYLQNRYRMELNGILVISGAINFQTLRFSESNDLPFVLFLPAYAATAWYHKALSPTLQDLSLEELVARAETFAEEKYAPALFKGTSIKENEFNSVAAEYARLTGLSVDYVKAARLRVSMGRFGKELLRERQRTVGRFDSRYSGIDRDSAGESYEFDASGAAIFGPFSASLNDYMRRELQFEEERVYEILTGAVQPWSYRRFEGEYVDASETLRQSMTANPYLKLFVACGYYDLATPFFAMDYTLDHLALPEERRPNVTVKYYEAGHMMYVHEPSLKKLRKDVEAFYKSAVSQPQID
ncbi:MAG: peptidase S10 [Pirellulaceae bacterium]